MHNLLPTKERLEFKHEYLTRFWTLALGFFAAAIMVGGFSANRYTLPLITEGLLARAPEVFSPEEPTEEDIALTNRFTTFKELLGILDPKKKKEIRPVSELTKAVIIQASNAVKLNSFSALPQTGGKMVISGTAADRESLVSFAQQLSRNTLFSSVDLPVSNLSKKTDIDFSITLTVSSK